MAFNSLDEVSKKTNLKIYTIRKLIREGKLPCRKLGERKWVVTDEAIEKLMKNSEDEKDN